MALKGRAFLAIWHDIEPAAESEYSDWHTRQHMPERLGIPGFLIGRRAVNWNITHQRWFTLYETRTLEVLSSDDYRIRLNNPSHWSNRTQPTFRNFARSACTVAATVGCGIGGALATIRLGLAEMSLTTFEANAERLAHRFAALEGVIGAHFGVATPQITRIRTREAELRASTGEDVFDAVVLVDGVGRRELEPLMPQVSGVLRDVLSIKSEQTGVYDLAYMLSAADMA
jgi:hypothetical protein